MIGAVLSTALAACPCYSLSSSSNSYNCGVEAQNGTNPTAAQWQPIFALVAQGPSVWGTQGPSVADIGQGCGKPQPTHSVPARFPCELLKAIAMIESSWTQFCVPTSPADEAGGPSRTIISFDCGYGVGQVTSGMHAGETPSFDRIKVASDPTYNLATGTQILAGKWRATNCVGDNQPSIIEDWYTSTWAYNGLAYSNNPSNPAYSSTRGVWNPSVGGSAPYQEKVFGRVEYPPSASYWTSVKLAYPDPATVGGSGSPPDLDEPACASPTNCASTRATHVSGCFTIDAGTPDAGEPHDAGTPDAGQPHDAGTPDAGLTADAGTPDAGPAPDAGQPFIDAGTPDAGVPMGDVHGGCGCNASSGPLWWVLLVVARRLRRGCLMQRG